MTAAPQRLRALARHLQPSPSPVTLTLARSPSPAAAAAAGVTVALVSHLGGPHVSAYIDGLAAATAVTRVALVSPDGAWVEECEAALGDKLGAVYTDVEAMFASETPILTVVAYEAVLGPPIVRAVLEHGCHVMAEKPSAVSVEAIQELAALADAKGVMLMLALANRLLPEVIETKRLIDSGAIGKIFGIEMHMVADQTRLTRPGYGERWEASKARAGGGHLIWLGIHWLDVSTPAIYTVWRG